jgi:hypothetical protein
MDMFNRDDLVKGMNQFQIPEYMRGGLFRWIENGVLPGNFLTAIIKNDLRRSFEYADDENIFRIHSYIKFLYNWAPGECWGSEEKVKSWNMSHRLARISQFELRDEDFKESGDTDG